MPQLSSGTSWTIDGIVISKKDYEQDCVQICSDGAGGAIIVWRDHISGSDYDIYAQRVNSTGDIQWTTNGILVGKNADEFCWPQICSDGEGGALITWGGGYAYVQRLNSSGNALWTANGTIISTLSGGKWDPMICSDGAGGAIITWYDVISGLDYDIYAQKVNSTGDIQWTTNGAAICTANYSQNYPQICSDGAGGAIITWVDRRVSSYDIFAQMIDSAGDIQWLVDGIEICPSHTKQECPKICSNGEGGAIIAWQDYSIHRRYTDIYAQSTKYVIESLKKKGGVISFGKYYLLFTVLSVISLIIIKKRRIFHKFKL